MKYMFLLFNEEVPDAYSAEDLVPWRKFAQEASRLATLESGEALHASATATVVAVREGKRVVTDGPFIETKEQLGGYYVYDCDSRETATKIAAMIPWAASGHIEVRPLMELPSQPQS